MSETLHTRTWADLLTDLRKVEQDGVGFILSADDVKFAIDALAKYELRKPVALKRKFTTYSCPVCGHDLPDPHRHCPNCGQTMDWDMGRAR